MGYSLIDNNGTKIWSLTETSKLSLKNGHLDCAHLINKSKSLSNKKIIITCCMDSCIAMINGYGECIWSKTGKHFETINIGRVRNEIKENQIIVDVDHEEFGKSPLMILDLNGNLLTEIFVKYSRFHLLIDWFGIGLNNIVVEDYLYDGYGNKLLHFDIPMIVKDTETICLKRDIDMDGFPELLIYSNPIDKVYIFKTSNKKIKEKLKVSRNSLY